MPQRHSRWPPGSQRGMRPRTTIHSYRHSGVGRRGTRTLASFRQPCGGPAAVGSSRLLPQRAVCCRAGRLRSPHTGAPMFDSSACACRPGVGPTAAPCGHALMGTCSYKAEQLRGMTAWSRGRRVSAGGPHLRHWVERCVRGRPRSLHTAAPMLVAARAQAGPPQGPWRRIKPGAPSRSAHACRVHALQAHAAITWRCWACT